MNFSFLVLHNGEEGYLMQMQYPHALCYPPCSTCMSLKNHQGAVEKKLLGMFYKQCCFCCAICLSLLLLLTCCFLVSKLQNNVLSTYFLLLVLQQAYTTTTLCKTLLQREHIEEMCRLSSRTDALLAARNECHFVVTLLGKQESI